MKKNKMTKGSLSSLWAMALLALSTVTAHADVAPIPGPIRTNPELLLPLIAAAVILAAAVIVWLIIRNRKNK